MANNLITPEMTLKLQFEQVPNIVWIKLILMVKSHSY